MEPDPSKESRSHLLLAHERLVVRYGGGYTSNENWRNLFPPHFQIHHRMETFEPQQGLHDDATPVRMLRGLAEPHFNKTAPPFGLSLHSRALLVLHRGTLIYEYYAPGFNKDTRLHGWSMTKSIMNALIAIRIQQGKLKLDTRLGELLPVEKILHPEVANITVKRALQMCDGLDIDEVYLPLSGVTDMLFNKHALVDTVRSIGIRPGAFRDSDQPCFEYNSLTTNLLSMALRNTFASAEEYLRFPPEALFEPLGMDSAMIEMDSKGVLIASSFGWATARDWHD